MAENVNETTPPEPPRKPPEMPKPTGPPAGSEAEDHGGTGQSQTAAVQDARQVARSEHAKATTAGEPEVTAPPAPADPGISARDVHGVDRTAMREVDVDHVWQNGDMYVQRDDGQIVRALDNGNGTHDVVVRDMSNPTGNPTTVLKDATDRYVQNKIESGKWQ